MKLFCPPWLRPGRAFFSFQGVDCPSRDQVDGLDFPSDGARYPQGGEKVTGPAIGALASNRLEQNQRRGIALKSLGQPPCGFDPRRPHHLEE